MLSWNYNVFSSTLLIGIAFALWLYFDKFNDLSETQLVLWSYIWIPLVVFGIAGNMAMKNLSYLEDPLMPAVAIAIKWTIVLMAGLIIFYELFWDQL